MFMGCQDPSVGSRRELLGTGGGRMDRVAAFLVAARKTQSLLNASVVADSWTGRVPYRASPSAVWPSTWPGRSSPPREY